MLSAFLHAIGYHEAKNEIQISFIWYIGKYHILYVGEG